MGANFTDGILQWKGNCVKSTGLIFFGVQFNNKVAPARKCRREMKLEVCISESKRRTLGSQKEKLDSKMRRERIKDIRT